MKFLDTLALIYSQLYNSADDFEKRKVVHVHAQTEVNKSHPIHVFRITTKLRKKAVSKLKPGKSGPIYSYSQEHLALDLMCSAVQSHVSLVLLLSTLIPLVKDKLYSTSKQVSKAEMLRLHCCDTDNTAETIKTAKTAETSATANAAGAA